MSKKKRRKRPAPLRQPDSPPRGEAAGARRQGGQKGGSKASARSADRTRRPRAADERRRVVQEWAHPPVALSVVRGLQTAGASSLLVVSSFLSALVLWLIFTAYGAAPAPSAMVLMTALPPVHSLLIDIGAVLTGGSTAAGGTLLFLAGLLVLRAGLLSLWVAGSLDRLERRDGAASEDALEGGRAEVSRVLRRAVRAFTTMLGIEAGFYVLSMVTALLAVGFAIGQLAVIGGLIGGLLFLVFAPVIAVAEGAGPAAAFRLSIRAARLPGPRHMMATVAYVAMTLVVSLFAPTSRVAQATPAITTWLFVLFVTFLHVSALAMFVYRWLAVRDRVLQEASKPSGGKRERAEPAGLR